jgi:hypothetical protein
MARNKKFQFLKFTPEHGKVYEKGSAYLIIYRSGSKKYWPDFKGDWNKMYFRNKNGMDFYRNR